MKIYRVGLRDDFDEHKGYEYFSSKREALKFKRETDGTNPGNSIEIEVEEINIKVNKKGILGLLIQWASHPDNG